MKSATLGVGTSPAEVTNVDIHGIWVLVGEKEYFLPHEDFPWFKKAKVEDILNLELHHRTGLSLRSAAQAERPIKRVY
jgi:hypothetical protein